RYMVSNKVIKLWVNMVRKLDLDIIAPQHGRIFKGKAMIDAFLSWVENLECGIDVLTQDDYCEPK
ncbi:MAG: MBL fold metallo-hydrolase, partial [Gammaproteobacteria bacterium]|nr:MBL fold metallo-hydrolase [Gammaproteobacteria bacterium]